MKRLRRCEHGVLSGEFCDFCGREVDATCFVEGTLVEATEKKQPFNFDEDLAYLRKKIFAGLGVPEATLVGRPASDMAELYLHEDADWLEKTLRKILSEKMLMRVERMLKQHTLLKEAMNTHRALLLEKDWKTLVFDEKTFGIPKELIEEMASGIDHFSVKHNPSGHQFEGDTCSWCGDSICIARAQCPQAQQDVTDDANPVWVRRRKWLPPDNKE